MGKISKFFFGKSDEVHFIKVFVIARRNDVAIYLAKEIASFLAMMRYDEGNNKVKSPPNGSKFSISDEIKSSP